MFLKVVVKGFLVLMLFMGLLIGYPDPSSGSSGELTRLPSPLDPFDPVCEPNYAALLVLQTRLITEMEGLYQGNLGCSQLGGAMTGTTDRWAFQKYYLLPQF